MFLPGRGVCPRSSLSHSTNCAPQFSRSPYGNNEVPIPLTSRSDELGEIARSVEVLRQNAAKHETMQQSIDEASERELQSQRNFAAKVQQFQQVISRVVDGLGVEVEQLHGTAEALSEASETATFEAGNAANVSASAAWTTPTRSLRRPRS